MIYAELTCRINRTIIIFDNISRSICIRRGFVNAKRKGGYDIKTEHKPTLRALSVLELVAQHSNQYTLSELSSELGIPASTLLPIVHTLRDKRYLAYNDKTQSYSLGYRLFELGSMIEETDFFSGILDIMHTVVDGCGETCHFGVLSGGDVLYLAKVNSPQTIRMYSMTGRRLPAYSTAIGKALLRDYTQKQLREVYPDGLKALMPNTITDIDELYRQLLEIRKSGFAYEQEESNKNLRCIAVPVCIDGKVSAALSVSIPVFRYSEELRHKIETLLVEAADFAGRILPFRLL